MDVLPALVGVMLVALAAGFALLPFARRSPATPERVPMLPAADERLMLYRQVLELDLDQQLGKLSAADHAELSSALLARASDLLRQERGTLGELDAEIEQEIAAARAAFAAARRAGPPRTSGRAAEPIS